MRKLQAEQLEGREVMSVTLADGVLDLAASDAGSTFAVYSTDEGVVEVQYDLNDGLGIRVETFTDVAQINFVGGAGNDVYVNATAISDVAFGGAGNDVLVGGSGAFSFLSGGDGDDLVVGQAFGNNEVSGDDGADYILILAGVGNTISSDVSDTVFSF